MVSDKPSKVRGILLESDYSEDAQGKSRIQLWVRTENKLQSFEDQQFSPYFYVIAENAEPTKKELQSATFGERKTKVARVEIVQKENAENALQLFFDNVSDLTGARDDIGHFKGVLEKREYDIPFAKRYLIDKQLEPSNGVEIEYVEKNGINEIHSVKKIDLEQPFKIGSWDIETYSTGRFPDPKRDPIIMISLSDNNGEIIYTFGEKLKLKEKFAQVFANEKSMVRAFVKEVKLRDYDILLTYNGDSFDFPYLRERCKQYGISIDWGPDGSEPKMQKKGIDFAAKIAGVQHVDVFQVVQLLVKFNAVTLVKQDLESVYEAIFGEHKKKLYPADINNAWETKELDELIEYNRLDALATKKILEEHFSLFTELGKLVKQSLYDVTRNSTGIMVEHLILDYFYQNNLVAPNKPKENAIRERAGQTYAGGYVRSPLPGLHENIAVLDFRSFHPSVIISHNISPDTIDCEHESCKKGKNVSPDGNHFCEKKVGFVPKIVQFILTERIKVKESQKKTNKGSLEWKALFARQWSLKILLNSFYGTLGYPRFRWYSFESARAIASWTRQYIQQTTEKCEQTGFLILYNDTDSLFIVIPNGKSREDVEAFVKKTNQELPEAMELELEGFYKRGIFVTKRDGGAAKKRYALIDDKKNLKIVGFEYVRRDWSAIAKNTQKAVIQAILEEGNPEKAKSIIRDAVTLLKGGKAPKKDLVMFTIIQKSLKSYEIANPHISASLKAEKRGKFIEVGSVIGFIITKNGKSISDKAELEEYVKEGDYDSEYYIENQLLPSILRIMQELGYSREDLIEGGSQKKLGSYM